LFSKLGIYSKLKTKEGTRISQSTNKLSSTATAYQWMIQEI